MATKFLCACVCLMFLQFNRFSADSDHGEKVLTYKSDNFATQITKNKHFVMFYAPWCGHCKRLSPTWNELAKIYNKDLQNTEVIIAKVDCTADTAVCAEHDITGYPTIKFFSDESTPIRYKGGRDLDSLQKYVEEQLNSADDEQEEPQTPEPGTQLVVLDDATFEKHIAHGQHFIKFYAPWCGHCQRLAPVWNELATTFQYNEKVTVAKIDCTTSKTICSIQHIQGYPTLLWFKNGQMVEQYKGARSHEALEMFVSNMLDKEDPEVLRTDDMIEVNTEQPEVGVLSLTDENFDEVLTSGYVFVKFYAPWCGHCKMLAPTWEELSKKFSNDEDIKIAEIDCSKYGSLCKKYEVRGYPTLLLFHNSDRLDEYNGQRGLEDMYRFVMNHAEKRDEL